MLASMGGMESSFLVRAPEIRLSEGQPDKNEEIEVVKDVMFMMVLKEKMLFHRICKEIIILPMGFSMLK